MNDADDRLFLYMVRYCSGGLDMYEPVIHHAILSVGTDEADAIEKVKSQARNAYDPHFTAEKVEAVMDMPISVTAPAREIPGLCGAPFETVDPDLPPLTVYIENAAHPEYGGATLPLPMAAEVLRPWLEDLDIDPQSGRGIVVKNILSPYKGLASALSDAEAGFEELNCLAANITAFGDEGREAFPAVVESGMYGGDVSKLINAALNIDAFYLQPAYSPAQYGAFLVESEVERFADVLKQLEQHGDDDERDFAALVDQLIQCVDFEKFGERAAKQEEGVFTDAGYLTLSNEVPETYRSIADMPAEQRLFAPAAPAVVGAGLTGGVDLTGGVGMAVGGGMAGGGMAAGVDLAAFLLEMHVLGGDYMRDAKHNVQLLARPGEDDFLVMAAPHMVMAAPALEVYHRDTQDSALWVNAEVGSEIGVFAFAVTSRDDGRVIGNVYEMRLSDLQDSVCEHGFGFTHMDAEMRDGSERVIPAALYYAMDQAERDQLKSWVKHYDPENEARLTALIGGIRRACDANRQPVPADALLAKLGAPYMAAADNPQPGMLRVSQDAARAILATNAAAVYRLTENGTELLTPLDAVKFGVNDPKRNEFAIKADDLGGVEKWAERSAAHMLSRVQRDRERDGHGGRDGRDGQHDHEDI